MAEDDEISGDKAVSQSTLRMFKEVYEQIRLGNEKLKLTLEQQVLD